MSYGSLHEQFRYQSQLYLVRGGPASGAFVKKVICESQSVWTSRLRLYPEYFYGIGIPIPPPEEQREIVKAVDRETGHYDRSRAKIERSIDMLQEYRTALRSAAVTGEIDVRDDSA